MIEIWMKCHLVTVIATLWIYNAQKKLLRMTNKFKFTFSISDTSRGVHNLSYNEQAK